VTLAANGAPSGVLVHDVNNLLAAILNYASFVGEEISAEIATRPADESARLIAALEDVREIGAAAERAAELLDQVRTTPDPLTTP
jgi:hypothetical protein